MVDQDQVGKLDEQAVIALLTKLLSEKREIEQKLAVSQKQDKQRAEEERWARIQKRAGTFTPEQWKLRATYDAFHANGKPLKMHPVPENASKHEHAGAAYCLCHGTLSPLSDLLFVRPGYDSEPGFVHRDVAKAHGWPEYIVK